MYRARPATAAHLYGPFDRFPLHRSRKLAEAPYEIYKRNHDAVGFERGVITQPSDYGYDNACLFDALARAKGNLRGVISQDPDALTPEEVQRLDELGVRGVRMWDLDRCSAVADRVRQAGWHLEVVVHDDAEFLKWLPHLERLSVDLVFDHMGDPKVDNGIGAPAFDALLASLCRGRTWVKLALPFLFAARPAEDALPFARALLATNADRCVYASGFPYNRSQANPPLPDDGELLDLLADWAPDEAVRVKVLAANPARLYRF